MLLIVAVIATIVLSPKILGTGWQYPTYILIAALAGFIFFELWRFARDFRLSRRLLKTSDHTQSSRRYFQTSPLTKDDTHTFKRPDGFHIAAFEWFEANFERRILNLTGDSGVGKSSVISAWLIPKFKELSQTNKVVEIRVAQDPVVSLISEIHQILGNQDTDDLSSLTREVAEHLGKEGGRLLVVLDQFEELTNLDDVESPIPHELRKFLGAVACLPKSSALTVLLSYRQDYMAALENQKLIPNLRHRENWLETPRLNLVDAREHLENAPVTMPPEVIVALLDEAQGVEETRGLVRFIVLNFLGMCVGRHDAYSVPKLHQGALLSRLLRDFLAQGQAKAFGERVARQMVREDGVRKVPQSVGDLARASSLTVGEVSGSLILLEKDGVVRRLPTLDGQFTWELSHDFLGRVLANVFRLDVRGRMLRSLRKVVPYAIAGALAVGFLGVSQNRKGEAIARIAALGIKVSQAPDNDRLALEFPLNIDKIAASESDLAALRRALQSLDPNVEIKFVYGTSDSGSLSKILKVLSGVNSICSLSFDQSKVSLTQADLSYISSLARLQSLDLSNLPLSDEILRGIEGSSTLTKLKLSNSSLTDACLRSLERMTELVSLDISGNCLSGQGLKSVAKLVRLENLDISSPIEAGFGISEPNAYSGQLKNLEPLTMLTTLDLSKVALTMSDIDSVVKLKKLRSLQLSGTQLTDEGLARLVQLSGLNALDISGTKISDAGVQSLFRLKQLTTLSIHGTQIRNEKLEELRKALPKCEIVDPGNG